MVTAHWSLPDLQDRANFKSILKAMHFGEERNMSKFKSVNRVKAVGRDGANKVCTMVRD